MLTVYLDSQDFSHFSMKHKDHAKYASLKAELLQLKKGGHVRFVFSDVHIYEVFPTDSVANEEGLERIGTMAEFCGKDSLPSVISLIEHEVRTVLSKSTGVAVPALSCNWFPDAGIANQPLDRGLRPPNRKDRRIMESRLRKSGSPLTTDFRLKYPFIKNTDTIVKYFLHEVDWVDVVRVIEGGIQDIKSFATWLTASKDSHLDLPEILRGRYRSYVDAVMSMREEVARRVNALDSADQKDELSNEIGRGLDNSIVELRSSIARRLVDELKDYDGSVTVDASMPSFDALLRYLAELLRRSAQLTTPRKPSGSDFADALHVSYLPRVDIIRTDAAAADTLARVFPERKEDILADVFKLPARIMAAASDVNA